MLVLVISLAAVLVINALLLLHKMKQVGKDPAILTMHSVVTKIYKKIPLMVISVAIIFSYIAGLHELRIFFIGFLSFAFIMQILLLILFKRTPTQPVLAYCCIAASLVLLSWSTSPAIFMYAISLLLFIAAVARGAYWEKHKVNIYHDWIYNRAYMLDKKYQSIFNGMDYRLHFSVLLIVTTEDIARPAFSRIIEKAYFIIKKPPLISSGIMQVMDSKLLTDEQSIKKGTKIVESIIKSLPHNVTSDEYMKTVAKKYNGSYSYASLLKSVMPGVQKYFKNSYTYPKTIL